MTRTATPKLGAYTALAGLGLVAALVVGRPELAALAAPFAAVLVVGLSLAERPRLAAAAASVSRPTAPHVGAVITVLALTVLAWGGVAGLRVQVGHRRQT